jgi:hypothetical protein
LHLWKKDYKKRKAVVIIIMLKAYNPERYPPAVAGGIL